MNHQPRAPRTYLTLGLLALACSSCNQSEAQRPGSPPAETWRFAIEEAEGSVQHMYALKFKELIEQRSGGEVEVIVYPYGPLGTSTQMTEQLNLGVIELAMASPGSLGKFIPEMQVFLLHFVLSKDDRVNQQVLSNPDLLAQFDELYREKGLKLLSIFSEGEMVWTINREVRRPEDFRGVKMRVMTTPILLAAYRAYGASPTPMAYSEVYSALQLNMIDGQVNPVFAIERQKFHEVTDWMIFPHHAPFVTSCAANREFFEGLSPQRRELVQQVMQELDEYAFEVQTRFQSERLKSIISSKKRQRKEQNIIGDLSSLIDSLSEEERRELIEENPYLNVEPPLSSSEREAFRQRSLQVREVFLRIGGDEADTILEELLAAVKEAEAQQDQKPLINPSK